MKTNCSLLAVSLIILAVVACDQLKPNRLRRSEAQAILEKEIPTPSPAFVQITINEVTAVTDESIWGPSIDGAAFRAGLISRELVSEAGMGQGATYRTLLTPRGNQLMPHGKITIPVKRTIEIIGISESDGRVIYTITYHADTFAKSAELTKLVLSHTSSPPVDVPQNRQAVFQKFDSGWRPID